MKFFDMKQQRIDRLCHLYNRARRIAKPLEEKAEDISTMSTKEKIRFVHLMKRAMKLNDRIDLELKLGHITLVK